MVIGQIKLDSTGGLQGDLYLGSLLPLIPGPGFLINLDPQRAPVAKVYDDRKFIFFDVVPGQYAIVLWTPQDSRFVLESENSGNELVVNVEAEKTLDIGIRTISGR